MRNEIVKMVWKLIRPFVEKVIAQLLKDAFDRVSVFVSGVMRERSEQAKQKADAAREASREKAESDPIEAARQAGKEEAWREISEHYKRDIEALRGEMAQMRAVLESSSKVKLSDIESREIPRLGSDIK